MRKSSAIVGTLAMAGALAPIESRAALDHYPGSTCSHMSGGTFAYFNGTVMNNSSTSDMTVMCPLTMDGNRSIDQIFLQYVDAHPSINVSCTAIGEAFEGANRFVASNSFTSPGGPGSSSVSGGQIFGFTIPNTLVGAYALHMVCTIPRSSSGIRSHLVSIEVQGDEPGL